MRLRKHKISILVSTGKPRTQGVSGAAEAEGWGGGVGRATVTKSSSRQNTEDQSRCDRELAHTNPVSAVLRPGVSVSSN